MTVENVCRKGCWSSWGCSCPYRHRSHTFFREIFENFFVIFLFFFNISDTHRRQHTPARSKILKRQWPIVFTFHRSYPAPALPILRSFAPLNSLALMPPVFSILFCSNILSQVRGMGVEDTKLSTNKQHILLYQLNKATIYTVSHYPKYFGESEPWFPKQSSPGSLAPQPSTWDGGKLSQVRSRALSRPPHSLRTGLREWGFVGAHIQCGRRVWGSPTWAIFPT